jgi:hypothetical protein
MTDHGRSEELKHQGTDLRLRPILISVIVFVIVGAVIELGIRLLYLHVRKVDESHDVRRTFVEAPPPVPPQPRLETDPREDFEEYFRKEQETLNSYGWTSRSEGKVRIPIDRAIELFVERQKQ